MGMPLPGATVKAGGKAIVTNDKGEFFLTDVADNATLEVSYIGYKTVTFKASKEYMTIKMEASSADLNEAVVKGYYSTTKEFNTGSVSTVKGSDLVKSNTGDPLIALQGRVTGLYIEQSSGNAGAYTTVKLRGQNSIANGNEPLYIIDGIPFDSKTLSLDRSGGATTFLSPFASLNVDNIERIEVLKDADATAIYGSRGANGVILISTKKGKTGKATLSANVYTGAGNVSNKLDLLNTADYLTMRRKALTNDGVNGNPVDNDLNGAFGDVNKYTDWQKVFIGGTAHLTDANASVSGGTEKTQFLIGGGFRRETSVYPGDFQDRKALSKQTLITMKDALKPI